MSEQKRLDRPDRKKIADILISMVESVSIGGISPSVLQVMGRDNALLWADQILALFPDMEELQHKLNKTQAKLMNFGINYKRMLGETKREEGERIYNDIRNIEFESNSATGFLNKTLYYIKALKEEK